MANELIIFKRGVSANLPPTKTAGQVLFETDTGAMYIDDSDSARVQIRDTSKVQKTGDVMTGVLSVDVTSASLTSLDTQSSDVKGLLGVQINSSTSVPFIHAATKNNLGGGTGVALTSGGLTLVGGGENALKILNNAANGNGSTDSSGSTILSPAREELILASDNGISFFTGGGTSTPSCFINSNGSMAINTPTASNHATTKAYVDSSSSHLYAGTGSTAANSVASNGEMKIAISNLGNSAIDSSVTLKGIMGSTVFTNNTNGIISIGQKYAQTNRSGTIDTWQQIMKGELTGTADVNIVLLVTDNFSHSNGLLSIGVRCSGNAIVTDSTATNGPRLEWLSRQKNINPNHYRLHIINYSSSGTATRGVWFLECLHHKANYAVSFEVLQESSYNGYTISDYALYTTGPAVETGGSTFLSKDTIPIGGTWNSATASACTDNAKGITLGTYEECLTSHNKAISIGFSSNAQDEGTRTNSAASTGSIAIGMGNTVSNDHSFAAGFNNTISSVDSCAIGRANTVSGYASSALGYKAQATGTMSYALGGWSQATGYGSVSLGCYNINNSYGCCMIGRAGKVDTANTNGQNQTTGDVFIVGNGLFYENNGGYVHSTSNALRLTYGSKMFLGSGGAYNGSGADYAEFVKEWADGNINNEDRVGYMVTIRNNKLEKAGIGDHIIGVTSGAPVIIGNSDEDYYWKYEKDDFNRIIYEDKIITQEEINENTGETITTTTTIKSPKLNDNYDDTLTYIHRENRPEWDYVGMRGIVPCRDDGTCVAGGFCKCGGNGIATYASQQDFNTYYVIERLSENVVSVEVK